MEPPVLAKDLRPVEQYVEEQFLPMARLNNIVVLVVDCINRIANGGCCRSKSSTICFYMIVITRVLFDLEITYIHVSEYKRWLT